MAGFWLANTPTLFISVTELTILGSLLLWGLSILWYTAIRGTAPCPPFGSTLSNIYTCILNTLFEYVNFFVLFGPYITIINLLYRPSHNETAFGLLVEHLPEMRFTFKS